MQFQNTYLKNIFYLILSVVILASCGGAGEKSNAQEPATSEAVTEDTSSIEEAPDTGVLNPNMASKEELLAAASFMTDSSADALIAARPFLSVADFVEFLDGQFESGQTDELRKSIYLPLNLNNATRDEILTVPGVGEKMAHEFEEYRPYLSIEQFRREIGKYVSEEEVAAYEQYVFVPVGLNKGTKEQILAIPGVGEKMLHEFEEYRPYQSLEQFRREIGKYVDDQELARLERYIVLD